MALAPATVGMYVGWCFARFTAVLAPAITAITVVDIQQGVTISLLLIAGSVVPPLIGAAFAGTYLYTVEESRSD